LNYLHQIEKESVEKLAELGAKWTIFN